MGGKQYALYTIIPLHLLPQLDLFYIGVGLGHSVLCNYFQTVLGYFPLESVGSGGDGGH